MGALAVYFSNYGATDRGRTMPNPIACPGGPTGNDAAAIMGRLDCVPGANTERLD